MTLQDFVRPGAQVKTTVRTIYSLEVECMELGGGQENNRLIKIRVNGNGFLYNMVRIIAGTLLEVGKGNVAPEQMEDIIKSADRKEAGPTAPAKGLKLVEIRYV